MCIQQIIVILLVLTLLLSLLWIESGRGAEENFVGGDIPKISLCPKGTETFITKAGEQLCCEGDIVGEKCNGTVRCGLIVKGDSKIPSCGAFLLKKFSKEAATFCPKEMPNYWEGAVERGCTSGGRIADWSAAMGGAKVCKIYGSEKEASSKPDSCWLYKKLDKLVCPTTNSSKRIGRDGLLACDFMDKDKIPHTCYDAVPGLVTKGEWKNNINGCEGAKRYYIEKSLSKADAVF